MNRQEIIDSWNAQADEYNQWDDLGEDEKLDWAMQMEREACAKVCDDKANHCETKAQEAIELGEHDEVSAIRSTAWQISVCAAAIRARGQQ